MSPPLIHFLGHSRRNCQRKGAVRGQRTDREEVAEGGRAEKPGVTEAWPCSLCSSGESRCYFHPWPRLPTARVRPACSALSQSWPLTPSSAIGGTQKDNRTRSMSFRWWTQAWPSPHTPGSGVFSHWQPHLWRTWFPHANGTQNFRCLETCHVLGWVTCSSWEHTAEPPGRVVKTSMADPDSQDF